MEYYLTHMIYQIENVSGQFDVTQLVKASNKERAREVVIKTAENKKIIIIQVRVDDTLIGS
jgi:hypothetical protein